MLIEQGPWALIVGLEWHMAMSRAEIAVLKKAHLRLGHVVHKAGAHTWLGFHDDVDLARVHSAALLLGQIKPNCIVHMALEQQLFWFCVVQNGLPLVGVDVLVDKRHLQHHLQHYTSLFPSYEVLSADASQGGGLTELLDTWGRHWPVQSEALKLRRDIMLTSPAQRKRKLGRLWVLGVCGVILVCALLALLDAQMHLQVQAKQKIESALKSTRMAELALQSKAVQLKAAQGYAKRFGLERARYLFLNDAVAFWRAFNGLRRAIPLSANGLHPLAIHCEPHACWVDWALRGELNGALSGAFSALKSSPGGPPFALDQGLNARGEGTSTLALSLPQLPYFFPAIESPDVLELYMTLELKKHWPTLTLSPMKTLVLDAKAGVKVLSALAPGSNISQPTQSGAAKDPSGLPQRHQVLVHQGEWQLSLLGDAALIDAEHFIAQVHGQPMALQSIVYTYQGALELKGMHYFLPPFVAMDPSGPEFEGLASALTLAHKP